MPRQSQPGRRCIPGGIIASLQQITAKGVLIDWKRYVVSESGVGFWISARTRLASAGAKRVNLF